MDGLAARQIVVLPALTVALKSLPAGASSTAVSAASPATFLNASLIQPPKVAR
jgi:hypothetical protein